MKKLYAVSVPVVGYAYKEVEAENEKEALELALEDGFCLDEVEDLEMYEKIIEGNVCYTRHIEADVYELAYCEGTSI